MRLVYPWLCDFVRVPGDPDQVAHEIGLRGFEVAAVEHGRLPVIDFEITANRPDCLSHIGLAREASAIWGLPLQMPEMVMPRADEPVDDAHALEVTIEDADLCPRYCAQVFDVTIGPSPDWLRDRLEAAGVRPINNVVDVTNYVMLELGQPMHAFDLTKIRGRHLVIRRARGGERLKTLDGNDRELTTDMLVIADAERASAVGGVMGGAESEIDGSTKRIALESAYFHPASIRRTSKRLGLKTEASSRFERGGDVNAPPAGIARAAALFNKIGAGRPVGPFIDRYPTPRKPLQIRLRASRIARVLGQAVPPTEVPRILTPLGFLVAEGRDQADPGWLVTVPTFRVDVTREIDLIEEVGRHFGFDQLPVTFPVLAAPQGAPAAAVTRDRLIRHALTAAGFSESMTFAFIEREAALPFCAEGVEAAAIANPLSEKFAVLRPSLLPGLVDSCAHNRRRGRKDVQLFETGSRFTAEGEGRAVGLAWSGGVTPLHWSGAARTVDFFDMKGAVQLLCEAFGVPSVEFRTADRGWLVRGRSAEVVAGDTLLGTLGQLQPSIAEARGLTPGEELYVAELDALALAAVSRGDDLRAQSLPRFPSIVRDVSILVDEALPAAAVRGTIRSAAPSTLVAITEFDRYAGKGVPEGRVSLSLRLTFRAPDRTLTDEDAQAATEKIVTALGAAHGAERR
ncbi:MAG TPA: phenylalanine--tRNA ligase subunit beta [Vicinamibacterales bacterium]